MSNPKIAVILGTTREARLADKPAKWLMDIAAKHASMDFELLDLRDYPMPFFDEVASNAYVPSTNPVAQQWQKKIAEFDGYIFLTGEYNNSVPAVLKNALDYAYPEWGRKPVAMMGYGSAGGVRSVQHLREIAVELQMAPIRHGVYIMGGDFMGLMMGEKDMSAFDYLIPMAEEMLNQLEWWATTLKAAR